MLCPEINAGLDAGPIQKMCGAGYVPGLDLGENLTYLKRTFCIQKVYIFLFKWAQRDFLIKNGAGKNHTIELAILKRSFIPFFWCFYSAISLKALFSTIFLTYVVLGHKIADHDVTKTRYPQKLALGTQQF